MLTFSLLSFFISNDRCKNGIRSQVVNKLHTSVFSPFSDEVAAAIHRMSQWYNPPPLFLKSLEVHFFQENRLLLIQNIGFSTLAQQSTALKGTSH
jgi:hypothetical protein